MIDAPDTPNKIIKIMLKYLTESQQEQIADEILLFEKRGLDEILGESSCDMCNKFVHERSLLYVDDKFICLQCDDNHD